MNRYEKYLTGLTAKELILMKHEHEEIRLQSIAEHEAHDAGKASFFFLVCVAGLLIAFFIGG